MARRTENLLRWVTQHITANRETIPSSTATATATELGPQRPTALPNNKHPKNASQRAAPPEIICIDDSDDEDFSPSDGYQDQENLGPSSALHFPGCETASSHDMDSENEESEQDEASDGESSGGERSENNISDTEQEEDIRQIAGEAPPTVQYLGGQDGPRVDDNGLGESDESDFSGSEDYESETSNTENEEDAEQDAGEAPPAVQLLGGPTDHRVDDEDAADYSESDLYGSEDYDNEASDAAHDYQGGAKPVIQEQVDQEMADAQQTDDDDDMDNASDFSDRPQGIESWIPNNAEEALPTESSAVEPVEHWPPDLTAWASVISKIPDSDPNKHLIRIEWNPKYPHSQLPPAEMKSIMRDICLQKGVVVRSISVHGSRLVDIYLDTAAGRRKLITSRKQWLHQISVGDCLATIDASALPPPPRIPNRAHELPFTFRVHWTCHCPPYKGWESPQDATTVVENIRAALESSGDSLLAATAPRVYAAQIRPLSGDVWVYVCSIPACDYLVRKGNDRLWVHRLRHGHRAQICLQEARTARRPRRAIATQRNPPSTDTTGNTRRGGIEDANESQRKRRLEKRRRQRARQRERRREGRRHQRS